MRIEKLKRNFDIVVKWVHFPLHPDTPAEGRSMAEIYAGRGIDPQSMYERMKGLMDAEGLPYGKRTHSYNSRLAQELGKWADTQDGGDALHEALYRAYFVDTRNIGDPDVLLEIVGSVGLSMRRVRSSSRVASRLPSMPIGRNRGNMASPASRLSSPADMVWSARSLTKCSSNSSTRSLRSRALDRHPSVASDRHSPCAAG